MQGKKVFFLFIFLAIVFLPFTSYSARHHHRHSTSSGSGSGGGGGMPGQISAPGEKVIVINPNVHAFGAYTSSGDLVRSGMATAGGNWCPDIHRRCKTRAGSFRIYSLGSASCKSHRYPLPRGGAPMPYCMFFNGNQGLHGSYEVVAGNISHGCVRINVGNAEWLRFNFVDGPNLSNGYRGTRVIVMPY